MRERLEYTIHACVRCGHHFARGPADADTLRSVYAEGFFDTAQQKAEDVTSPVWVNAQERVTWLRTQGLRGRLLEVGAGKGAFIAAAAGTFDAIGMEFSPTALALARAAGRSVVGGQFPEACPPGVFDVVVLWDVLASLPDPHAAMREIRQRLRAGGQVVFTVPFVEARVVGWLNRYWPLWIPPVNLHYYSRESLRVLLAEQGFELIEAVPRPKEVALRFLLQKALREIGARRLAEWVGGRRGRATLRLNLGDILTVRARTPVEGP